MPDHIPAAHKGDMGGCSFFGFRPDGSRFLLMNIFGGGWGGRPARGWRIGQRLDLPGRCAQYAGRTAGDQISLHDRGARCCVRTAAAPAEHRGGLGVVLTYRCLQKCKANINLERLTDPPWGLHGGRAGAINVGDHHARQWRTDERPEGDRDRARARRSRAAFSPPAAAVMAIRAVAAQDAATSAIKGRIH